MASVNLDICSMNPASPLSLLQHRPGDVRADVPSSRRTGLRAGVAVLAVGLGGLYARRARAADDERTPTAPAGLGALAANARELTFDGWIESDGQPPRRIAQAAWRWAPRAEGYRLTMEVDSAWATLVYESSGRLGSDGLRPQRYREVRKSPMRATKERVLSFDEAVAQTDAAGQEGERLALPLGGQDRLSVVMQWSLLAQAQPARIAAGIELTLPLASWRAVETARFIVGGHESVDLGARTLQAQRIRRATTEADQTGIELWLADDAQRTPAVIRFGDEGRALRFTLAS
jgi:hypothetical protein